jgi:hypothetical protein
MAFVMMAALAGAGCGGNQDALDANEVDEVAADVKADGATPLRMGTYDVDLGVFYSMTLKADGTFKLFGGCKPGPTGPHCFAIVTNEGNYRLTRSGSKHYIRLVSDISNELLYRFQYKVSGAESENVSLTETHTGKHYTATLQQADRRQDGESCGGFVGTASACADGLICKVAQHCCDIPGVCTPAQ